MPSRDIDYSKTVIYRIVCNDLSVVYTYVGSTTDLTKRKNQHKTVCNNPDNKGYNLKLYTTIRENNGWDAWSVVLVENYPCNNGTEARQRERYWLEFYGSGLNVNRPFVSDEEKVESKKGKKETKIQYRIDNADHIKELNKQYRIDNADHIKELNKQYRIDNADHIKELNKQYRIDNADHIKELKKQYRDNSVDKIKESNKQYYVDNKDKIKEIHKQYYVDNKDKIKEIHKQYYVDNKDKLKEKHICDCGGKYRTNNKTTHFKTKKHKKFIETNGATL